MDVCAQNYLLWMLPHLLKETVKLLLRVRAAKVCGPGVADGELVELQHVHDSNLSHSAAKQLRTLVHAGRWGGGRVSLSAVSPARGQ